MGLKRLKVLISAYACDPTRGSEPGMGGNWVIHLAEYCDLWVITESAEFAKKLEAYLSGRPDIRPHVTVVGVHRRRFGESIWSHLYYYTYMLWQREAFQVAMRLHQSVKFDLVHQLNMIGYREPGYLWKLDVPFVWGPIGGFAQMAWAFLPSLGLKGALHYGLRNVLNAVQMRTSTRVKAAMARANALISATEVDKEMIKRLYKRESTLLSETACGDARSGHIRKRRGDGRLRLIWCGIFLPRKALHIALRALDRTRTRVAVEMHIVGDGPCAERWKKLARALDVDDLCNWHGRVSHDEVMSRMESCDAMIFTSIQDATATVVVEALQSGLPVICHDAFGFGKIVDSTCGIKVVLKSPEVSIAGFSNALIRLSENADLLPQLSAGALERAASLSWPLHVERMLNIYTNVTGT